MSKRTKFWMSSAVFDKKLSASAFYVYGYLSWCANKQGICYPAVSTIAKCCVLSTNTVRTALKELTQKGLIRIKSNYITTNHGRRRQTSNTYYLLPQKLSPDTPNAVPPPSKNLQEGRAENEEEMNNNAIHINSIVSVDPYEAILADILDSLALHNYDDPQFARAVQLAIEDMFFAPFTVINGEKVSQYRIRKRLESLDVECIDRIQSRLGDYCTNINSPGQYLKTCIYNAPADVNADLSAINASLR